MGKWQINFNVRLKEKMKDQITCFIVLFLAIYFYTIREELIDTLLRQQKFADKYSSKSKACHKTRKGYLRSVIIISSIIFMVVGILTILGVLHAK